MTTPSDDLDALLAPAEPPGQAARDRALAVGKIAALLDRQGIDVADIGRVNRVNVWQAMSKDADGEPQITDLVGVQLMPGWAEGPAWPVVQQAKPCRPRKSTAAIVTGDWDGVAVVLPDEQIGFRRDYDTGDMDPFHDEAAMAAALAVVREVKPSDVIHLGDLLDLPAMGRFRKEPGFAFTAQATLDRAHEWLAQCAEAAPRDARQIMLEGNHDRRLGNYVTDNAVEAFGLRQANAPESWPVMSVPYLLRLDELGVEYVDGYPAGMWFLNDRVAFIHGERLDTKKVLDDESVTVLHGHTHRWASHRRRRRTRTGSTITWAASPGCLCRVDGAVPSVHGSTTARGKVVKRDEDWHQGLALVYYRHNGDHTVEMVPIDDGVAHFRGRELRGT